MTQRRARPALLLAAALALLVAIYLPTLLTQPAGSSTAYMDDVGEIQVALNLWGTIHFTGYPAYTMLGSAAVSILRALGVDPAAAPSLFSMGCGLAALGIFFALIYRLTGRAELAAAAVLILGLTRSVWVHNVIAEVYSMTLLFVMALLAVALWPGAGRIADGACGVRRQVWLMALIGGFGVAHHRMVAFMAPGLLLAVWPDWWHCLRSAPRRALATAALALPIALIGFIPYLYLPARALAGANWVYNTPGTWQGFWWEFSGGEAGFLMQPPQDGTALLENVIATFRVIGSELTLPIALISGAALAGCALFRSRWRREARIVSVCALGYLAFLFIFHRAVMPEAVSMPAVAMLVFGLALGLDTIKLPSSRLLAAGAAAIAVPLLALTHAQFVYDLTHDPIGLEAIALAERVPRDEDRAVLMLPWGPRYTATAFSIYVSGHNADLALVKHTADLRALVESGHTLYTSRDTFYRFPTVWWEERIGRVYLTSAADGVVAVRTAPRTAPPAPGENPLVQGIALHDLSICAANNAAHLEVSWRSESIPAVDLSVFMHVLPAEGDTPLAQADSSAPVYGWYPTTRWTPGEVVTEHYVLPLAPGAARIAFGLYEQPAPGQFVNYEAALRALDTIPACPR